MSASYTNPNYAPPPSMAQMNLVNGMPHLPPTTAMNSSNLSKFMPPNVPALAPHSAAPPPMASSAYAPPPPSIANGPLRPPPTLGGGPAGGGPAAAAPPATITTATTTTSNLPPHLRPAAAGMNGPLSVPFTNGGGGAAVGGISANSSRTASPALQQHSLHQQQQQQQQQQLKQQQQQPLHSRPLHAPAPPNAASANANLTGSMQNLSLNRTNGAPMPMPPTSQPPTAYNNFQSNFKASALNATTPMQPPPPINASRSGSMQALNTANPPLLPPPSIANSGNAGTYGISTAPLMMSPTQVSSQNSNYAATALRPPPLTAPSVMQQQQQKQQQQQQQQQQQNQLNNNPQQQQQPQQHHLQSQQPAPIAAAQRKPMYPSAAQLPPMPTQQPQQQQQQPYAPAYHQQQQQQKPPPPQPGMFNGQASSAPLQYQTLPTAPQQQQPIPPQQMYAGAPTPYQPQQQQNMSVTQQGFSRLWGQDTVDLMQNRHILTPATLPPPKIVLHNQFHESINCNPNIMRCTVAKIPESSSLLQKSRLPLGILIHPFRDINSLPVIQCPNIVRCRLCRTYINPFVYFVDSKMWKCNLCYRVNELPDDFQFDPATKTYGDVTRRPEVRSSTIEFIAPSEYMLRPPQPAIYLFLFDVSIIAQQSGYLENVCAVLSKHLDDMPGDARTQVGFVAYNSEVHFYSLAEGYNQPHEMTLLDIDDPFLPRPDNLLVNLKECKELVKDLLTQLPKRFAETHDPGSAMGAALQVAYKLMQGSGGRVTVFQTCLPNKGPGALEPREDPNNRSAKDVAHLNPATDFYKRYALECSGYQIAVDLFLLNQQYSDLATISGISKHSGGCIHHFPLYQKTKPHHVDAFKQCFKRYLVRKIGFEAVMRIRCTRGLQVHTFHGNCFVRSTDLLSLPNVNPDAGYGMQISYEESLSDVKTICFQAALLYTNSEGERRIRVHTLCLPVTASLPEVMHAADAEAIIGLLSKMAVDRSVTANVADAREAFINATVDILNAFKIAQNLPSGQTGQLIVPRSLALLPLYISALLKHPAFRVGTSTRLDDRLFAMDCMKTLPLDQLMKYIYPEFYHIDALFYNTQNSNEHPATDDDDEDDLPDVPRLQLSAEYLDSRSIFLLDCGILIIIYVGLNVPANILESVFGVKSTAELPDYCYGLPNVNSAENDALKRFIIRLNDEKPYPPIVQIIRDTSTAKPQFIEKLIDDRSESSLSYYEFLQHIRTQVK